MKKCIEWLLRASTLLALVFISFSAGVVAVYYRGKVIDYYDEALEAVESFYYYYNLTGVFSSQDMVPAIKGKSHYGVVTVKKPGAYNGYTLLVTTKENQVLLMDMDGTIVHEWHLPASKLHIKGASEKALVNFIHVILRPNGDLVAMWGTNRGTPYGHGLVKLDKDSNVLWSLDMPNVHHDLYVAENRQIYALEELSIDHPVEGMPALSPPVLDSVIRIISPDGKELGQISLLDAFRATAYEPLLYGKIRIADQHDVMHANSVIVLEPSMARAFPMFKPGQLLVSLCNHSLLAVIDPKSKKVVWAVKGAWAGQHQAVFLRNGHIMLFDNEGFFDRHSIRSRVLEFDPATLGIVWEYAGGERSRFYSPIHGNAQLLPNNDVLITDPSTARLFEVTRDKQVVWELDAPLDSEVVDVPSAYRFSKAELPFLR